VVLTPDGRGVDEAATAALRRQMRDERRAQRPAKP